MRFPSCRCSEPGMVKVIGVSLHALGLEIMILIMVTRSKEFPASVISKIYLKEKEGLLLGKWNIELFDIKQNPCLRRTTVSFWVEDGQCRYCASFTLLWSAIALCFRNLKGSAKWVNVAQDLWQIKNVPQRPHTLLVGGTFGRWLNDGGDVTDSLIGIGFWLEEVVHWAYGLIAYASLPALAFFLCFLVTMTWEAFFHQAHPLWILP